MNEDELDELIRETGDACRRIEGSCELCGHKKIQEIDAEND